LPGDPRVCHACCRLPSSLDCQRGRLTARNASCSKSATCDRFDESNSTTLQNPEDELALPALPSPIPPVHHVLITGASRGPVRVLALGFSARGQFGGAGPGDFSQKP
jgi:hypothetical protein